MMVRWPVPWLPKYPSPLPPQQSGLLSLVFLTFSGENLLSSSSRACNRFWSKSPITLTLKINLNYYSITMSDISPKATVLFIFEIKQYHPVIGSDWMSIIFSVFCLFVCCFFFVQCAGVNRGPANWTQSLIRWIPNSTKKKIFAAKKGSLTILSRF